LNLTGAHHSECDVQPRRTHTNWPTPKARLCPSYTTETDWIRSRLELFHRQHRGMTNRPYRRLRPMKKSTTQRPSIQESWKLREEVMSCATLPKHQREEILS
jgi:hypothetical protein